MKVNEKTPAKVLEEFLNSIDTIVAEYNIAQSIVETEEKRLQDLLHAIEFAKTRKERDKVTTRLHNSRKLRRENKNKVLLYEPIIKFYNEKNNRDALNRMRQLLGQQRKNEEKVNREKIYTPRIEDEYLNSIINGKEDEDGETKI
ncbi:MAG: hypothetical protein NC548_15875 [Lachnospiraceae bacterium]|nr:hypothetical protein [Lachnospiraceae bacterium]